MSRRSDQYIGAYAGADAKRLLVASAAVNHRTLSGELLHIVELHLAGRNAEREACAQDVCRHCRTDRPVFDDVTHRFVHPVNSLREEPADCDAAAIHMRTRAEERARLSLQSDGN